MFDHSIKVPRLYKNATRVAKEVSEGKGSIKQLVYECKHPNIKAIYALVVHTYERTDEIERLLKKSKLLVKEPRFDPWLAKILITELLWGKKQLSGQSRPVKTILAYEQIFKAHLSDLSLNDFKQTNQVGKPRYVRINTLKITVNEAIEGFREEGWILKRFTDKNNYLGFLEAVGSLDPEEFMVDLHIPYLLIFPPKTQFYKHPAYKKGSIILQDKASCLPVHILSPKPGSTVLDMCAAPGMKTSQCAAVLDDTGKIYAVEIGKKRFDNLQKIIESSGATCVEVINADVLTLREKDFPNVEYILVDPSCSGSGITDRVEIGQQPLDQDHNRLEKLASFQVMILKHAFIRFPMAKRVVYSTCSIYTEENEDVVRRVLETCTNFKLVAANQFLTNKWQNFGSSDFGEIGSYCLSAKPDIDLTSGFFVAVFERLEEGGVNQFLNPQLLPSNNPNAAKREREEFQENENQYETPKQEMIKIENKWNEESKLMKDEESDTKKKKKKNKITNEVEEIANAEKIERIPKQERIKTETESNSGTREENKRLKDDGNRSKTKKKKKEIDTEVEKIENVEIERHITIKGIPKQKRIKTENESNTGANEENKHLEDDGNSSKKKKKKKNIDIKVEETENERQIKIEGIPKQKRIKTEHEPNSSAYEESKHLEDGGNSSKKKKKKKIDLEVEEIENAGNEKDTEYSKKKRKLEGIESEETTENFEFHSSKVHKAKKKKKNKERDESEPDNLQEVIKEEDASDEKVHTSKKKKKQKKELDQANIDVPRVIHEENIPEKRKTKKNRCTN